MSDRCWTVETVSLGGCKRASLRWTLQRRKPATHACVRLAAVIGCMCVPAAAAACRGSVAQRCAWTVRRGHTAFDALCTHCCAPAALTPASCGWLPMRAPSATLAARAAARLPRRVCNRRFESHPRVMQSSQPHLTRVAGAVLDEPPPAVPFSRRAGRPLCACHSSRGPEAASHRWRTRSPRA
jgi:hypothetical protein